MTDGGLKRQWYNYSCRHVLLKSASNFTYKKMIWKFFNIQGQCGVFSCKRNKYLKYAVKIIDTKKVLLDQRIMRLWWLLKNLFFQLLSFCDILNNVSNVIHQNITDSKLTQTKDIWNVKEENTVEF